MRKLLIATAAVALALGASPALADTLKEVIGHGIIIYLGDMEIPVTYTPDGKFSAMDGQVTGAWRIDGDKLCTSSSVDPNETCVAYPKDKKSGDTFMLESPQGSVQIKIR
ncbi:hypothetical protein [Phenylobacterium sp.]|jgi:hypothetical protein|uniref:hypothetical protein n=1 Tax=Phenylobacterium sp. TaxID=1871053 RepID=UPI002F3EA6A9